MPSKSLCNLITLYQCPVSWENRKVSLAVERPANKERLDQVQRLLTMIENKPPSIVLEADVKEILSRYNSKLQSNKAVKQRSALSKSTKPSKRKVSLDDKQINMVNIGMDNEHLQEDLEKVPKKTYETSLARLKEQPQGAAP
ncbi:hypothetical protein GCK32_017524 [Trichostrongylus colubriformis]|uniref:Type II secretion system protein GspE N-terminal domain-containing protein n=2 Tax=Trichostrongylus colubriformis TaxID=6319 RepID=A0AAN8IKD1_TRICO